MGEEKEELLTAIVVQPEPIIWIPGPPDDDGEVDLDFPGNEWQDYPYEIDPKLEFRPFRGSNEFNDALKHLTCSYCHETGNLVASHHDITMCPRCGNTEFDDEFWMT
jgi:ribosomal protein S27AE